MAMFDWELLDVRGPEVQFRLCASGGDLEKSARKYRGGGGGERENLLQTALQHACGL